MKSIVMLGDYDGGILILIVLRVTIGYCYCYIFHSYVRFYC